jgi:glyoxylase-like metal-dependent hydrolase (beta-lactamase superfamily II)
MCPRGARGLSGSGGLLEETRLVAHCLLIESGDSLVLVDTGYGTGDCAEPARLGRPFRALIRPSCDVAETAERQIRALGLDPADVRDVIVTHLDLDHAGGLGDFPSARVHLFAPELDAALNPSLRERSRYVSKQWEHGPAWTPHEVDGDDWFGFGSVRLLPELEAEVALIPLVGHTRGHSGVAVRDRDRWLLHCGDSFFHRREVADPPSCPPMLAAFQAMTGHDREARRDNLERLRELGRLHRDEVELICSHDPVMYDRVAVAA